MSDSSTAIVYLQVEPKYTYWAQRQRTFDTIDSIEGAKIVGYTLSKPQKPKPGTVVVKVAIQIPKAAFVPLQPEAVVVIPETMTQANPVTVEAQDPNEGDEESEE